MKSGVNHLAWRLLGAFIGLVAGGTLGLFLGEVIAKLLNISNFEGGRGYFVVFLMIPLFAIVGAILGAIMIYLPWQSNLGISAILLVALGVFLFSQRHQFIPTHLAGGSSGPVAKLDQSRQLPPAQSLPRPAQPHRGLGLGPTTEARPGR